MFAIRYFGDPALIQAKPSSDVMFSVASSKHSNDYRNIV